MYVLIEDDDEGDDEPHDQYHHHHHQMKLPELLNIVDAISDKMRVGMKHFIDKFIGKTAACYDYHVKFYIHIFEF